MLIMLGISANVFAQDDYNLTPYDGPVMMGRGQSLVGMRGTDRMPLRPYISVNGTYDSNLLAYAINPNENIDSQGGFGVEASFGVRGQQRWRRTLLGIDYMGTVSHYSKDSYYDGSNHAINLGYMTRLSKRWVLQSNTTAGTSNRVIGGPAVFDPNTADFLAIPANELFDSRYYTLQTQTGVVYYPNLRDSVRLFGTGGTTRRKARALVDVNIYGAGTDWARRLSRQTTIGIGYTFNHYDFAKVFGETNVHSVNATMARQIGRDWRLVLGLSGFHQNTIGIQEVPLDPVLAELLGRPTGRQIFESQNLLYGFNGALTRTFKKSVVGVNGGRSVMPGNGLFLTSTNTAANVYFSHTATRRFNIGASAGYSELKSLGFSAGKFGGWTVGGGVLTMISQTVGINTRVDWRQMSLQQTTFNRNGVRVAIGITYTPTANGVYGLW